MSDSGWPRWLDPDGQFQWYPGCDETMTVLFCGIDDLRGSNVPILAGDNLIAIELPMKGTMAGCGCSRCDSSE